MQQTLPAPRKPSGGRPPSHMIHNGLPYPNYQNKQPFIQPPPNKYQPQHHMSMPPPSPKTLYPNEKPQINHSDQSSRSSRPSPALSAASDRSLHETGRVNIRDNMSPRQPSATMSWDEKLKTPREAFTVDVRTRDEVEVQFDHLLESLQVPASVRQKFETVSNTVKSSILTSSLSSNPTILNSLGLPAPPTQEKPKIKKRLSTPLLRKQKSSSSIGSPGPNPEVGKTYKVSGDQFTIVASPMTSPNLGTMGPPATPQRGQSMELTRPSYGRQSTPSRPLSLSFFGQVSSNSSTSLGRSSGKGLGISMSEGPETFISWLGSYKATDLKMDVGRCKKLRMLLRHESTYWVGTFLEMGGYRLILARLQDLLDVEWREEQHDDQMLYEILRCIKALSTSEIGKTALRSNFPNPFPALSKLLFSEKKPGDLPSRQIIIELWLFLFELFPSSSSASLSSSQPQSPGSSRPISVRFEPPGLEAHSGNVNITTTIRELLVPDIPDPRDEQHEFITKAHRPRVFKAWVGELSDICRDYFWIMCHGSNMLWALDEVDEGLVEKPVAPGGATGGVEYEAMNYVTIHFKLLNAFARQLALEDMRKARELHMDLMSSGMDRILVTLRKASTTYYPTLHLQLAHYVHLLRMASPSAKLPYLIDKLVGSPPEILRRSGLMNGGRGWLPPLKGGADGGRRGAWDVQAQNGR